MYKTKYFLCIALALAIPSCQSKSIGQQELDEGGSLSGDENSPLLINHPKPEIDLDYSIFEEFGCVGGVHDIQDCELSETFVDFMCDEISKLSDLLGPLDPAYSIAKCIVMPDRFSDDQEAHEARLLNERE